MKNWQEVLVPPDMSLKEVIQTLNSTAKQLVLVVSSETQLLGTITDGDIRRSLLAGKSLNCEAKEVMNKNPKSGSVHSSLEENRAKMARFHIHHLPLLDGTGRVVGVQVLEDFEPFKPKENRVLLMAGGLGTRMGDLTSDCPKPLLNVGDRPILEIILLRAIKYGFRKFDISVNYKAEMIERHFGDGSQWGVEIDYIREPKQLGTAGALGLLRAPPSVPLLVMNGDVLTKVNLQEMLNFHIENKAVMTVAVREYDFHIPFGVVKTKKNRVLGIDEKPVQKYLVSAGIYIIEPNAFELIAKQEPLDMPELIESIISKKLEVSAFPVGEYWLDVGRNSDFERAKGDFLVEFAPDISGEII